MEDGEPNAARRSNSAREARGIQFRRGMYSFEFGSGPVADPRVGRPSGHVVPHPVPVVRNTRRIPSPPSSTPDTPYPGRTIPGVTLSVPSMTDHLRARARLLYSLDPLWTRYPRRSFCQLEFD